MDISAPEELAQPVLTAEAVRKTLPYVCLKDDGSLKSEKSIQNILSGFNQMLKVGLLVESRLSVQMESEFQLTLQSVREYAKLHKKTQWPSFLNDVRAAANDIINFDTSNMTFAETLTVMAGKKLGPSFSKYKLSKLLHQLEPSVAIDSYYGWMQGRNVPRFKRTTDAILSLDIKLNANGALKDKVKKVFITSPEKDDNDDKEEKSPYILPPLLIKEMNEYIDFRLNDNEPKEMPYLDKVDVTSKEIKKKLKADKFIDNIEWSDASSSMFESKVIFFAKYIEEVHPEKFESMSLSTFFNDDILEKLRSYITNKGTLSSGLKLLKWIKSECSKNSYASVYLHSHDEFCLNIDDWVEELDLLNIYLQNNIKKIEKKHEELDGARNVEWILDKENPAKYVKTISEGLWHDARTSSVIIGPTIAAMMYDMLIPCPIRAKNVSQLRWMGNLSPSEIRNLHRTETCALYFDKDKQRYTAFIHKAKLKNHESTTIKSIIQPLPYLSDKFDQYLSVREEYIKMRGWVTDTLFPLTRISKNIKEERLDNLGNIIDFTLGRSGVYGLISKRTKGVIDTYFPEENILNGINTHGMRHLSASLFLRDNPENYVALATLLMDNLETVVKIYARRDDIGNHEKIAKWGESLMGVSNAA